MRSTAPRVLGASALAFWFGSIPCGGIAGEPETNLRVIFAEARSVARPSAEEIVRRALENSVGFDAALSIEVERVARGGDRTLSAFLLQRHRMKDARRLLFVSMLPASGRGNRVLQIDYDSGRDETYVFVQAMDAEPVRASFRVADPFLSTWHEIGPDEPPAEIRALAEYEILGMEPVLVQGEPADRISLRALTPRGYNRTDLVIARGDFAILEQRQYADAKGKPVLVTSFPRDSMVRFGDHLVPERMLYRDLTDGTELKVKLRYAPLPEGSDARFYPGTFSRAPIPMVEGDTLPR